MGSAVVEHYDEDMDTGTCKWVISRAVCDGWYGVDAVYNEVVQLIPVD